MRPFHSNTPSAATVYPFGEIREETCLTTPRREAGGGVRGSAPAAPRQPIAKTDLSC